MSKPQSQNPQSKPESFFEAPVYTREELGEKLKQLSERVKHIGELLEKAKSTLDEIYYVVFKELSTNLVVAHNIIEVGDEVEKAVRDAVDEIIIQRLQLDIDIEKYEKRYNVSFPYETERQLGVALIRENSTVKPVVIWTNYKEIGYYEGEKDE
jgi:FtsZ-binding cell division protein ZapB